MRYWILILVLRFLSPVSEKSEWEIHYLISTFPETYSAEVTELLLLRDSAVVTILESDSIKRYHYYPGESDIRKIYYLTKDETITIDPQSLQPMESPFEIEEDYSINCNSKIKKTGHTKQILGFQCAEYEGSTMAGEIESFSRFWIYELPEEGSRELSEQYYLKEGLVLEKENISTSIRTGNKLTYMMKAVSAKRLN